MTFNSGEDVARRAHFTYIWAIENASTLTFSSTIRSPTFVVQTMEMTKWYLEAKFDNSERNLMLFICREPNGGSGRFEIDFELSLLEYEENTVTEQTGTSRFQEPGITRCGVTFDDEIFCELSRNETLTIRCRMWRTGYDILQYDMCFARTHMRVERQSFVWAIKRFSSIRPGQNRTIFLHPTFKNLPILILTFCLREKDGKEYGCITVHRSQLMENHSMDVEVCLLDAEGCSVWSTEKKITALITHEKKKVCEFSEFFERTEIMSKKSKFLVNDVLSLRFEFEISAGPLWNRIENYSLLESSDVEAFASDISETHFDSSGNVYCPFKEVLKTLYEDGTLSDVSLKAGSQSFSVHKNILSARSPVFKAMFTKDMREKTSKCVDIPDVNAETMRRLLLYIYTDKVEALRWEDASDLFRAADKYELLDLLEICSDFLKAKISTSNAREILVLADMHHDEDLLKAVQNFLFYNPDVVDNDAFKYLSIAN